MSSEVSDEKSLDISDKSSEDDISENSENKFPKLTNNMNYIDIRMHVQCPILLISSQNMK